MTEAPMKVEQVDREAAADIWQLTLGNRGNHEEMRKGRLDHHSVVQAFARHRLNTRPPTANPLPDEVERVAQILNYEDQRLNGRAVIFELGESVQSNRWRRLAKAIIEHLSTDRDSVIEECAKVLDVESQRIAELYADEIGMSDMRVTAQTYCDRMAAAIRARRAAK